MEKDRNLMCDMWVWVSASMMIMLIVFFGCCGGGGCYSWIKKIECENVREECIYDNINYLTVSQKYKMVRGVGRRRVK